LKDVLLAETDIISSLQSRTVSGGRVNAVKVINSLQASCTTTNTTVVSVEDIKIYPNPTAQYISLRNVQDIAGLRLYDIIGRQVKTFTATHENQYDVSSLPVGLYLVRVVDKNLNTLKTLRLKINYP